MGTGGQAVERALSLYRVRRFPCNGLTSHGANGGPLPSSHFMTSTLRATRAACETQNILRITALEELTRFSFSLTFQVAAKRSNRQR
jgi:hypothetical protein